LYTCFQSPKDTLTAFVRRLRCREDFDMRLKLTASLIIVGTLATWFFLYLMTPSTPLDWRDVTVVLFVWGCVVSGGRWLWARKSSH
jgi:hypothetical protein